MKAGASPRRARHTADGSGTEVLIMHDGFVLAFCQVSNSPEWTGSGFDLPAHVLLSGVCVSDLNCVHSNLESC